MESIVRLKAGVEWQPVDDEIVALDLDTSAYVAVNDTGALLWPLVAKGTTQNELIDVLTARFLIDDDRARADVGGFVDRLRALSLVVEDQ